jgi:hypothetical protein
MSAVDEENSDIDLQLEPSSDNFQDAQIDPNQSFTIDEELSSIHGSDDEAGPSTRPTLGTSAGLRYETTKIVPDIENDPFAEEPSYHTRPNRYFGPDPTWLSWTREDRRVAETLDSIRSQDLSIHLFNAYALKQAGLTRAKQRNSDPKGKGKARETPMDDDLETEDEGIGSFPPTSWTAWPLPPEQVPRHTEVIDPDQTTFRTAPDPRPSAELEESLISTALLFARERWGSRSWELEFEGKRDMKVEHDSDVEMAQGGRPSADQSPTTLDDTDVAETFTSHSDSGSEVFVSQRWNLGEPSVPETKSDAEENTSEAPSDARPVPLVDDEIARNLLLPGTRHVLSQFDDLLMALHTARQAYAVKHARNKHAKVSQETSDSSADSNVSRSRPRKRKRSVSVASHHSNASTTTSRPPRLNPRDWSDVIGMATLTGFSPSVIERTSARCASLFNSNMLFRTFEPAGPSKANSARPNYTTHQALSPSPSPPPPLTPKKTASIATTPIRTSRACTSCASNRKRCLPSTNTPGTGPCRQCIASGLASTCSGITTKAANLKQTRCPHPSCDRHYAPFKKSSHLQRHLDSVHLRPQYSPILPSTSRFGTAMSSSPIPPSSSPGPASPMTDFALPGGGGTSRTAGIPCPITSCPRHTRPFSRAARLYEHLRTMHPEVDILRVKELERKRRGDGRGRWARETWDGEGSRRDAGRRSASRSRASGRRAEIVLGETDEDEEDSAPELQRDDNDGERDVEDRSEGDEGLSDTG